MIGSHTESQCEMCDEVRWAGSAATGDSRLRDLDTVFSRLILRTPTADVFSGLGSLIPGYSLVVPHRHTASMGELAERELSHVFEVGWQMTERIKREFGRSVVLVEHGSSGNESQPGGSCIVHSHLHLFPLKEKDGVEAFVPPGSRRVAGPAELAAAAGKRQNYYYCTWKQNEGHLLVDPKLPSQFARRVWAGLLDYPDPLWDWAAFPFFSNCRRTATSLSGTEDTGTLIEETLLAYCSAAEKYARKTSSFAPDSTLPAEIAEMSRSTDGVVLDAGSGGGRDALCFAEHGREVVALDACLPLISMTPQHPRLRPVSGDVRSVPLPDSSVGAVWCSAVLLHMPPDEFIKSLLEFHRVLKPDGLSQISVKEGKGHIKLPISGHGSPLRHFFFYRVDELRSLARRSGFEVVRTWTEDELDSSASLQRWVKLLLRKVP
ncbi:methyltransferase domain-containing protein [Streptomyces sp. NPDC020681]|uniref:methyltransferase domain-containing protein n=1 Tax=Streptomyces sp. NPDC020681 TaxID=3365083 RepID=UPI0037B1AF9D